MHSSEVSTQRVTAQRLTALSRIGAALMSERDEAHLFQLIVETARDLIGATFAALTLRPVNAEGEPLAPSEGHLFHLAAIVGVTPEQEAQLRRLLLGGEGLLLGHSQPGQFTHEDEIVLAGLAAQAAVALEHVRWYRTAQMRAQELDAIFESNADGVTLVDPQGNVLRENGAARRLRERLQGTPAGVQAVEALLSTPARRALSGEIVQESAVRVDDQRGEAREYLVNASPLRLSTPPAAAEGGEHKSWFFRRLADAGNLGPTSVFRLRYDFKES